MKADRGFTLIELLITVAIVAVLLALAVPSFRITIQNNQMVNAANTTVGALQFARMEAVSRANTVSLRQRNGTDWTGGLIVWFDSNNDGVYSAGEEIRVWEPLDGGLILTTSATSYEFKSTGGLSSASNITLCDSTRTGETGRTIEVLVSGMVAVEDLVCS